MTEPDRNDLSDDNDSTDDEQNYKINLVGRKVMVAWEDSNQQMQYAHDLQMDLDVNVSENQAFFALRYLIFCKGSNPDGHIYLLIFPEDVESIKHTYPSLPSVAQPSMFIALRFSMTKPPSLEIPTVPFKPKPRSINRIATITALASVQDFTIYFDILNLTPAVRSHLLLLPSIFSSHHLKTVEGEDSTNHLHHRTGGQVIRAPSPSTSDHTSTKETVEEPSPPPYEGRLDGPAQPFTPTGRKRQRTSELLSPSTDKRILLALDQVVQRLDRLEEIVPESIALASCRYDTEEAEHIISHVDDRIDDQLTGVHIQLEEKVMEGTEQLVAEKTEETQEQLRNGIREELLGEMREEVRHELKKLMTEIKTEVFRDMARMMMSAAYGGNEKARMSFDAESQATESTQ